MTRVWTTYGGKLGVDGCWGVSVRILPKDRCSSSRALPSLNKTRAYPGPLTEVLVPGCPVMACHRRFFIDCSSGCRTSTNFAGYPAIRVDMKIVETWHLHRVDHKY